MAIMYPKIKEKLEGAYAEQKVYDALSGLPNDFIIFHSVNWVRKNVSHEFTWYENDFLILHPKFGILVLEVKGGIISCENGLIHQKNSITHQEHILDEGNDPFSQAKRGKFYFRNLLYSKMNVKGRILIEPMIWFPSCEVNFDSLPQNYRDISFAILDGRDLAAVSNGRLRDKIISIYKNYNADAITDISDVEFRNIQNLIAPDFRLIPSSSICKGELDQAFVRLTKEQAGLLDYIQEQRTATIQGVAGTGKTMIAIEAAKRYSDDGRHVLFLCFNRLLYEHLKKDCAYGTISYYNINTFLKHYTGFDAINTRQRIELLERIDIDKLVFDDIIIDEAQDFENEEILYFKSLSELHEGHFLIFYDKNQLMTTREIPQWISNAECRLVLTKNCRNTYEIACTAYNVIDLEIEQKISMIHGNKTYISFVEKDSLLELSKIIRFYLSDQQGYRQDEITILSMTSYQNSILNDVKQIDGINLCYDNKEENGIFFTTAKKFKGLESKVVIIIDIDNKCFADESAKRAFYVACSRATHNLHLFLTGDDDKIRQIAACISGGKFSGKGKIIVKTQSTPFK